MCAEDPIMCESPGFETTRRGFLTGAVTTLAVLPTSAAFAGGVLEGLAPAAERSVRLRNAHTGEILETVFWSEGSYTLENLGQIYRLFRDRRTGGVLPIDIRLIGRTSPVRRSRNRR